MRIFTGAPVPPDADMVLIQEDAEASGDAITLREDRDRETHIRPAAGDFPAGARVAAPRRLGPVDLALLAAMNAGRVRWRAGRWWR